MPKQPQLECVVSVRIDLPPLIAKRILAIQRKFSVYYPGHKDSYPHITLYYSRFNPKKLGDLRSKLKELAIKPFKISFRGVMSNQKPHNKGLFVYVEPGNLRLIRRIHRQVLPIMNELRGGLMRRHDLERTRKGEYSPAQMRYLKEYGSWAVLSLFDPHITIGEIPGSPSEQRKKLAAIKSGLRNIVGRSSVIGHLTLRRSYKNKDGVYINSKNYKIPLK